MEVVLPDASGTAAGRRSSDSSPPEFEFWMVTNPSFPQTHLLSADELFVDGVILPLHLLPPLQIENTNSDDPLPPPHDHNDSSAPDEQALVQEPEPEPPATSTAAAGPSPSVISSFPVASPKRWKDIFRGIAGERKAEEKEDKKRGRDRKNNSSGGTAELNINIWPFSRSRSAGNSAAAGTIRQKSATNGRKASSAPCSRSNSQGESSKPSTTATATAARRWASSPARPGLAGARVHVRRLSPAWKMRKGGKKVAETKESGGVESTVAAASAAGDGGGGVKKGNGSGIRVLNLNVNTCIGYRQQGSCGSDDKEKVTAGEQITSAAGVGHGSHFNLKALFSKKVY